MPVEFDDLTTLEVAAEGLGRDQAMEAANRAYSWSQENLYEGGDEHDYEVKNVAQMAVPPQWDDTEQAAKFEYPHPASRFFEDGTQTHEIVADDGVLAFEWEDAPPEVQDMFASTFPTVFFKTVEVEGIEAIRFVSDAIADAGRWLEGL